MYLQGAELIAPAAFVNTQDCRAGLILPEAILEVLRAELADKLIIWNSYIVKGSLRQLSFEVSAAGHMVRLALAFKDATHCAAALAASAKLRLSQHQCGVLSRMQAQDYLELSALGKETAKWIRPEGGSVRVSQLDSRNHFQAAIHYDVSDTMQRVLNASAQVSGPLL